MIALFFSLDRLEPSICVEYFFILWCALRKVLKIYLGHRKCTSAYIRFILASGSRRSEKHAHGKLQETPRL